MHIKKVYPYISPEQAQKDGISIEAVIIVPFMNDMLVLCRNRWRGWQFPGGGVDWGESIHHAARRELIEETGAEFSRLEFVNVLWLERSYYRSLKAALYYADVTKLNSHHDYYEIDEVRLFQELPARHMLSYACEDEIYQFAREAFQKAA